MVSSTPRSEAAAAGFSGAVDALARQQGQAQEVAAAAPNPLANLPGLKEALAGLKDVGYTESKPKPMEVAALENKDMQRGGGGMDGPA